MMEIDAERELDRIFEHSKRLHVIGKCAVAKAGALFGSRHRFIDGDRRIVGEKPHEPQDLAERFARAMARKDRVRHGYSAGIDERIAWNAALELELDDGIEGSPRWLAPDAPPQPVA